MPAGYININGVLLPAHKACIRPDNRAFRYGYGLFETMLVQGGKIRLAAYHWDRLLSSMEALLIPSPPGFPDLLEAEVRSTIQKNGLESLCRVRLQVDAGHGHYGEVGGDGAGYVIESFPLEEKQLLPNPTGLVLGISDVVKYTGKYASFKTVSALNYALAAKKATKACWDDALLTNEHGNIADSTTSNIFWTKNGKIYTPPLEDGCVSGIMRRHLLLRLPELGYEIHEKCLNPSAFATAENVFLTNAVRGIRWVAAINEYRFSQLPHLLLNSLNHI